jgi:flagellar biosynthetic protein FliR
MTLGLPLSTLYAFLLVLSRVAGLIAFLPAPGFHSAPEMLRVCLALAVTFALFPVWPALPNTLPSFGELTAWTFAEAGFGLVIGLSVAFLLETFQVATQVLGLQAGYGYATTIDPTSQADAGVLQVVTLLISGLLFLTLGLDRQLFRVLAASFEKFPAGSWAASVASIDGIVRLGSGMFSLGLRLAMPVVALLLLLDVSLAVLGRMQQQLQLLSLAFPLKMLAALALLSALAPVFGRIFETAATRTLNALWQAVKP